MEPLPDPIVEPFWGEAWQHSNQGIRSGYRYIDWGEPHKNRDGSIIIQHLCGYSYSKENYKRIARELQGWGFECLRSRRGGDGKYWEVWYLPGLFMAKGLLAEFAKEVKMSFSDDEASWKAYHDKIVGWFCRNSSFGTLDIAIQRAAMTVD